MILNTERANAKYTQGEKVHSIASHQSKIILIYRIIDISAIYLLRLNIAILCMAKTHASNCCFVILVDLPSSLLHREVIGTSVSIGSQHYRHQHAATTIANMIGGKKM